MKAPVSSVASPICQEGQSERTFPIFAFSSGLFLFLLDFSWFFPSFSWFLANFSLSEVALCPPLYPQWLCHWKAPTVMEPARRITPLPFKTILSETYTSKRQCQHQGGHFPPSWRLFPHLPPPVRRKNGQNQPFFANFCIFGTSETHFAPSMPPQNKNKNKKKFWCRYCKMGTTRFLLSWPLVYNK